MSKTAILVDGGFYRKRAKHLWGEHEPKEAADALGISQSYISRLEKRIIRELKKKLEE